jgi:hypothetical protein
MNIERENMMTAHTDTVQLVLDKVQGDHARVRYMDRLGLRKADLVEAADRRGLATTGTRSAIAYRLARF